MTLLAVAFTLVATGALIVAARTVAQLGRTNQAMLVLLADTLAAGSAEHRASISTYVNDQRATRALLNANHADTQAKVFEALAGFQAATGQVLTDAVERTATAIGQAVQTAAVPPPPTRGEHIEGAVRDYFGQDPQFVDPGDDIDPTDHVSWVAPERGETAFVDPGDPNPTGVPGMRLDGLGAVLPFQPPAMPGFPSPNGNG